MSHDLSGQWSGIFNYPHTDPPTAFEAEIADRGGPFTGTVREPDLCSHPPGALIAAAIDGHRDGRKVTFSKFYDDGHADYADMVIYTGTLNDDATEISGRWHIPGVWSGTFLMIRPAAVVVAAESSEVEAPPHLARTSTALGTNGECTAPVRRDAPDCSEADQELLEYCRIPRSCQAKSRYGPRAQVSRLHR